MATEAQIAGNRRNAQSSTGPRSAEGKFRASLNAVKLGVFSLRDCIQPDEVEEYQEMLNALQAELNPAGPMQQMFAAEIIHCSWRLRRCSRAEARLGEALAREQRKHVVFRLGENAPEQPVSDPMEIPAYQSTLAAIDRARAQTHGVIKRATAELRRLQTEQNVRSSVLPDNADCNSLGLASSSDTLRAIGAHIELKAKQTRLVEMECVRELKSQTALPPEAVASLNAAPSDRMAQYRATQTGAPQTGAKRTQSQPAAVPQTSDAKQTQFAAAPETSDRLISVARNAPCLCGSGAKYKRCCGTNAPAVLTAAA